MGDVVEATALFFGKKSVRESLQPNAPCPGQEHDSNTPLHYAASLAMKEVYFDLLGQQGGGGGGGGVWRPDVKNAKRKNCIHLLCTSNATTVRGEEGGGGGGGGEEGGVRAEMLKRTIESLEEARMEVAHVLEEMDEVNHNNN